MTSFEGLVLETERLRLRRARADDVPAFHTILADSDATRFWSTAPHKGHAETAAWLNKVIEAPENDSNEFVVEMDGQVIGKAGCWRVPEIGMIFHPHYWGQGLAFEAMQAVLQSTFAKFPVSELTADVDPRNDACLRLLARLGFRQTGSAKETWKVNGQWTDSLYLSLARERFEAG
jgi:RimJ/RimL family protein N-acetyltransferase